MTPRTSPFDAEYHCAWSGLRHFGYDLRDDDSGERDAAVPRARLLDHGETRPTERPPHRGRPDDL